MKHLCLATTNHYRQAVYAITLLKKTYQIFYFRKSNRSKKAAQCYPTFVKEFIEQAQNACTADFALIMCYARDLCYAEVLDMLQSQFIKDKRFDTIICVDDFTASLYAKPRKKMLEKEAIQIDMFSA